MRKIAFLLFVFLLSQNVSAQFNVGEQLLHAVRQNNLELVKEFVAKGADIDYQDEYGTTALIQASLDDELDIVKWLVNKGAEINTKDIKGHSALSLANNRLVIEFLTANGSKKSGQKPILIPAIGHTKGVNAGNFSPDGTLLVTASWDNTAKLWNVKTGELLQNFQRHNESLYSATFSPNGKQVLTTSMDKTAKLWDVKTGKLLQDFIGHTRWVESGVFSPNGKQILTSSWDKTAKLWDIKTGKLIQDFTGHNRLVNLAIFSPSGNIIATASNDKTAKIWNIKTGLLKQELKEHTGRILSISFNNKGDQVLTASSDNTAKLWDIETGELLKNFTGHTSTINSAIFSPNEKQIVTASWDNTAKLWDTKTGKLLQDFIGHTNNVKSVVFSPNGKQIVTASRDNTAKLWDTKTGKLLQDLVGHLDHLNSATFNPSGSQIVTTSEDKTAKLWDTNTGKLLQSYTGQTNFSQYINASDTNYLTTTYDTIIKLWDIKTGKLKQDYNGNLVRHFRHDSIASENIDTAYYNQKKLIYRFIKQHESETITSYSFSRIKIVTTNDTNNVVKLWNLKSGKLLQNLEGHIGAVTSAFFSHDSKLVVTLGLDNIAKLWDTETGNLLQNLNQHTAEIYSASFSLDDKLIVTSSRDSTAKLWNVKTGKLLQNFTAHKGMVTTAIFGPNNKLLATVSNDKTTKLWNLKSGKLVQSLIGHTNEIVSASFSNNGANVFTTSLDNSIKIWDVTTGNELLTFYQIDSTDWAILHPSGLFDASDGAMKKMHYVVSLEPIDLEQLKKRYYQPNLWAIALGHSTEHFRQIPELDHVTLFPFAQLNLDENILKIKLKKRDGGYGKVQIYVEDIEVIPNALPKNIDQSQDSITFDIDIRAFQAYFTNGNNTIKVVTWNHELLSNGTYDDYIRSRPFFVNYSLKPEKNKSRKKDLKTGVIDLQHRPQFYGIFIGISEYFGNEIDLKYADDDAMNLSKIVQAGAEEFLGKENVHIQVLRSGRKGDKAPTKINIKKAFLQKIKNIKPNDILLVLLSGHGAVSEKSDEFFYLTEGAGTLNIDDGFSKNYAISNKELLLWLNKNTARKKIIILDACYAGKAAERMMTDVVINTNRPKNKGNSAPMQRALNNLIERTGMYIIAGAAKDQSSYENDMYQQGLLTYSIIKALQGGSLKNDSGEEFAYVADVLNYAVDEVPILLAKVSKGINKNNNQQPLVLSPYGKNYPFLRMTSSAKKSIQLFKPGILLNSCDFSNPDEFEDNLHLSDSLNAYIHNYSFKGKMLASVNLVQSSQHPDAYSISGNYSNSNSINVTFIIKHKGKKICKPQSLSAKNLDNLIQTLFEQSLKIIYKHEYNIKKE